jgi:hypothetical protein
MIVAGLLQKNAANRYEWRDGSVKCLGRVDKKLSGIVLALKARTKGKRRIRGLSAKAVKYAAFGRDDASFLLTERRKGNNNCRSLRDDNNAG